MCTCVICTRTQIHTCQDLVHLDSSSPPGVPSRPLDSHWVSNVQSPCVCAYTHTYTHVQNLFFLTFPTTCVKNREDTDNTVISTSVKGNPPRQATSVLCGLDEPLHPCPPILMNKLSIHERTYTSCRGRVCRYVNWYEIQMPKLDMNLENRIYYTYHSTSALVMSDSVQEQDNHTLQIHPLQNNIHVSKVHCGGFFEPGASGLPYYCTSICVCSWCTWHPKCVDSKPKKKGKKSTLIRHEQVNFRIWARSKQGDFSPRACRVPQGSDHSFHGFRICQLFFNFVEIGCLPLEIWDQTTWSDLKIVGNC